MVKRLLLFVLAVGCVASAQSKPIQIQKAPTAANAPKINMQVDEATMLRRDVQKLRAAVQDLQQQVAMLRQAQADHPRCSNDNTSTSKLGSRDCGEFRCDQATGTCISSCNSTNDCTPGAVCDMSMGRCVVVPQQ